jgi:hypothetical protein
MILQIAKKLARLPTAVIIVKVDEKEVLVSKSKRYRLIPVERRMGGNYLIIKFIIPFHIKCFFRNYYSLITPTEFFPNKLSKGRRRRAIA